VSLTKHSFHHFFPVRRFDIVAEPNYASESSPHREVLKIYSMFLEGSNRHGRELVLCLPKQMRAIRNALKNKENCLHSVERVLMSFSDDIEGSLLINVLRVSRNESSSHQVRKLARFEL
jgi:hypothetical protein